MNQLAILYPVFVQVFLTVVVYLLLLATRYRALAAPGRPRGSDGIAMGRYVWPDDAEKAAHNQRNQFELPVLFYAVTAFALIVGAADLTFVALGWTFVASRILHAAIHLGPNKVRLRAPAFALGFVFVTAMWVKLFLHVAVRAT